MRERTMLAAGLAALTVVAAACGTNQEPKASGSITVYSGREKDLVSPLFEKFEQATGITVNARFGDTAELAAQLLEEGENSPADVFFAQDGGALGAVSGKGLFAKLDDSATALVPAGFRSSEGTWVGTSGRARVVVFNTDKVAESDLPSSIDGFTHARWKGKIGWAPTNGSFQAFVTGYRVLKGDASARAWLRGIKANGAQSYPKNGAIVEAVGAGEIEVGFVNHYYLLNLKKENPSLKAANHFLRGGDPGALVNVAGVGVLKSSENTAAARRFVDYLLGTEAQTYFATETSEYPLAAGVTAPSGLPALADLDPPPIDLAKLSDLEATLRMLSDERLL